LVHPSNLSNIHPKRHFLSEARGQIVLYKIVSSISLSGVALASVAVGAGVV
jgi:hypothetical protein